MLNYKTKRVGNKVVERIGQVTSMFCSSCYQGVRLYTVGDVEWYQNYVERHGAEWNHTLHRLVEKKREGNQWCWLYKCLGCGDISRIGSSHRNFNVTKE